MCPHFLCLFSLSLSLSLTHSLPPLSLSYYLKVLTFSVSPLSHFYYLSVLSFSVSSLSLTVFSIIFLTYICPQFLPLLPLSISFRRPSPSLFTSSSLPLSPLLALSYCLSLSLSFSPLLPPKVLSIIFLHTLYLPLSLSLFSLSLLFSSQSQSHYLPLFSYALSSILGYHFLTLSLPSIPLSLYTL
jgi:hypothetical protein